MIAIWSFYSVCEVLINAHVDRDKEKEREERVKDKTLADHVSN